jgi:hypothetical protein
VYSPTVDNTNVETMQFLVTDGATFTDLQTRDMTYTVRPAGSSGMACEVTSTAKSGKYRLVTTYLTDPARNSVLADVQLVPLTVSADSLHLYARLDPSINGNGGGGGGNGGADSAVVDTSTGHAVPVRGTRNTTATRSTATTPYRCLPPCGATGPSLRSSRLRRHRERRPDPTRCHPRWPPRTTRPPAVT